ncbi:MAG: hypothetical protein EON48_07940 [Acetobacteraceae bacterium]|nr:MAG: hypothetical protein EON48_07940 [Acetobacteraceae bacterium]
MTGPLPFATPQDWRAWLEAHHATETEVVLKLYKKASGTPSITWEEAVIEALAFGWIDSTKRPGGADHWHQRFSPRKPRSGWSQKNRAHVENLIATGRMAPAGLAHVEAAKADGRWDAAYAGGKDAQVPQDFLDALTPRAAETYQTLNAQNRFAIYYRLTTAKRPETRAKRLADFVAMLERGERFYP